MTLDSVTKSVTAALVTAAEWGAVAVVTIVALGIVWAVPNTASASTTAATLEGPAGLTRVNP